MSEEDKIINEVTSSDYKYGFSTEIDSDTLSPGLDEEVVKKISHKKKEPEWMTNWRLDAFKFGKKWMNPIGGM